MRLCTAKHLDILYCKALTMTQISSELAQCTLSTIDQQKVTFATLYQDHPTLIFFVRHFGCIFCRERVASLTQALPLLESHHLKAVVIGNGTPHMAQAFVDELKLPFPVYTDQQGDAYTLAGMQRMFGLNLASVKHAWRSYKAGNRQGKIAGNIWQQGGVMPITENGNILEVLADQSAGDYIDIEALVNRVVITLS